jgi:hypothetical protein
VLALSCLLFSFCCVVFFRFVCGLVVHSLVDSLSPMRKRILFVFYLGAGSKVVLVTGGASGLGLCMVVVVSFLLFFVSVFGRCSLVAVLASLSVLFEVFLFIFYVVSLSECGMVLSLKSGGFVFVLIWG